MIAKSVSLVIAKSVSLVASPWVPTVMHAMVLSVTPGMIVRCALVTWWRLATCTDVVTILLVAASYRAHVCSHPRGATRARALDIVLLWSRLLRFVGIMGEPGQDLHLKGIGDGKFGFAVD